MLELVSTRASVVGCFGSAGVLDALAQSGGAYPCRIAPDELMLVAAPGAASELVRTAAEQVQPVDPEAVVIDTTDGWAVWTLIGEAVREAFSYLSEVPLIGDGFVQGEVAHVPVKVIALPDRLHLLVPAMWSEHLRRRILTDCSGAGVRERPERAAWEAPAAGPGGREP